jgi:formylglycine-generating enzyme required for sulfatase activity
MREWIAPDGGNPGVILSGMARLARLGSIAALILATGAILWATRGGPPPLWVVEYGRPGSSRPTGRRAVVEGIGFVEISRGYFRMGSHRNCRAGDVLGRLAAPLGVPLGNAAVHAPESDRCRECPPHWVRFPSGFWLAEREFTYEDLRRFDPDHPSTPRVESVQVYAQAAPMRVTLPRTDATPLYLVDRDLAAEFCRQLAATSGLPVRLPSESEWECACLAGRTNGDLPAARLDAEAWYEANSGGRMHDVKTRRPNPWGIWDLLGNVSEWCADDADWGYVGAPSDGSPRRLPPDPTGLRFFVCRGGSWRSPAKEVRARARGPQPMLRYASVDCGFRPAFRLGPGEEALVRPFLVSSR